MSSLVSKIEAAKTVNISLENLLKRLRKKLDWSYFIGKSRFEEDGTQNYLVFQPLNKYFKVIANTDYVHHGNLKDYLMKVLNHLQHLIIVLIQH